MITPRLACLEPPEVPSAGSRSDWFRSALGFKADVARARFSGLIWILDILRMGNPTQLRLICQCAFEVFSWRLLKSIGREECKEPTPRIRELNYISGNKIIGHIGNV
jgi:hypothetical protein